MIKKVSLLVVAALLVATLNGVSVNGALQEAPVTVGVYCNDIDWALCMDGLGDLTLYPQGRDYVRTTDPYAYDNLLVLGGHMAPTDANMPFNFADLYLPDWYRQELMNPDSAYCFSVFVQRPDGDGTVDVTFIMGSDRENTSLQFFADTDSDGLSNGEEALFDTAFDRRDTDFDTFTDLFELRNLDGFYNPNVQNSAYFISFDTEGRAVTDYHRFILDRMMPMMATTVTGNGCTSERLLEFLQDAKEDMEDPERCILYIDLCVETDANGFQLADRYMTVAELDALLDEFECIKLVNIGTDNGGNVNAQLFGDATGKLISNTDIFLHLYQLYSEGRADAVDADQDGYLSLQEILDDYRQLHQEPNITIKAPPGSDTERMLTLTLFQFCIEVSF